MIALLELVEAEGRDLRQATMKTGQALVLLLVATFFLVAGAGLVVWALYQYLLTLTTPAAAAALVGLLAMVSGGGLLWLSRKRSR